MDNIQKWCNCDLQLSLVSPVKPHVSFMFHSPPQSILLSICFLSAPPRGHSHPLWVDLGNELVHNAFRKVRRERDWAPLQMCILDDLCSRCYRDGCTQFHFQWYFCLQRFQGRQTVLLPVGSHPATSGWNPVTFHLTSVLLFFLSSFSCVKVPACPSRQQKMQ